MTPSVGRTKQEWDEVFTTAPPEGFLLPNEHYLSGSDVVSHLNTIGIPFTGQRVLDYGCGAGRFAAPLTNYSVIQYEGIDCHQPTVEWCQQAFAPYPQFQFTYNDEFNEMYNPNGKVTGPPTLLYPDQHFEVILLCSILTHLGTLKATQDAWREITRVMKPGGYMYVTWFRSPPNRCEYTPQRTALKEKDIMNMVRELAVIHTEDGFSDGWHDQWRMVLHKEK